MFQLKLKLLCFLLLVAYPGDILSQPKMTNTNPMPGTCHIQFSLTRVFQKMVDASFCFIFLLQPSSVVHSPLTPSQSRDSSHFKSSCDKPMGPKCGACGEVGHNKNSKMCPRYFSPEAVQRREVL